MLDYMALYMFAGVCVFLLLGYPVALSLGGTALIFAGLGYGLDVFDGAFLEALPNRLFGIMLNDTLVAVPLFVFMGVMLERSKVAETLLENMASMFGSLRGGLGISVVVVGMLLAASTGIVGATVVTMGLLALPTMLKQGYDPKISTGAICASGTLGQIIPPSIVLILLGDVLSSAYQQAQLDMGIFSPETISVGDLFAGALVPGLLLVVLYIGYIVVRALIKPEEMPSLGADHSIIEKKTFGSLLKGLLPPLLLMVAVLGSILAGIATPTEAASVGAIGAIMLAYNSRQLSWFVMSHVVKQTMLVTSMVFLILIGASVFSLVFRGFGGDDLVEDLLSNLPGGVFGALLLVMLIIFLLGFVLDFIEITFVVVPIVGPILLAMGVDPVWLGVMIAMNLQTSFLTPPFGFALFYLRGVAPKGVTTTQIYRGVLPFIGIQLLALMAVAYWSSLATWLPSIIYG